MNPAELTDRLARESVVELDTGDREALLAAADIVKEVSMSMSGPIRVLSLSDRLLVLEETPEGQNLVRLAASLEEAERFIADRRTAYERMWDGCGCRIDYRK